MSQARSASSSSSRKLRRSELARWRSVHRWHVHRAYCYAGSAIMVVFRSVSSSLPRVQPTADEWARILDAHVDLWRSFAVGTVDLDPASWDILLCWLEDEDACVVLFAAKCNAPFWIPQTPHTEGFRQHFEYSGVADFRLAVSELDTYPLYKGGELRDEQLYELEDEVEQLRVRALEESLARDEVQRALRTLQGGRTFGIHWTPHSDSGWFVHLRHMQGPPLPEPMPATTAFAALTPLFWHARSFVGRYHTGLVFDGDELVEATLSGPNVTDETLALLDSKGAACCSGLRSLTFESTRATPAAVDRIRGLLPYTDVSET